MASNMTGTPVAAEEDAGMSKEYIDSLTNDLKDAERALDQYSQAAQKAQSEYTNTQVFCNDLTDYVDRITETYNKVIDIEDYISSLITQATKVCTNVNEASNAIKLIIECYKCVVDQTEELRQMVKDLLDAIERLGDPILNPGDSLVKCLNDLYLQLNETLQVQKTALEALLLVWRSVIDLEYLVCNNQLADDDVEGIRLGLIYDLEQLNKVLCCGYCGGSSDNVPPCSDDDDSSSNSSELSVCCGPAQELDVDCQTNKPALCNDLDNAGFNSNFYCTLKDDRDAICQLTEYRRCVWQYYEKQKQNAVTRHEAVKTALEAAQNAKALCN